MRHRALKHVVYSVECIVCSQEWSNFAVKVITMTIPDHLQVLQPVVLRHHTTGSVLATARLSLLDGGAWASLVTEASLLARVLYKSKNQHRASKHLKKLQQVWLKDTVVSGIIIIIIAAHSSTAASSSCSSCSCP